MKAYDGDERKPEIEVTGNAFKIMLPNRNVRVKETAAVFGSPKSEEAKILSFIETNGQIVRSDVEVLLDVSQATANRILKRMVKEGLIYQDGNGRNTKYKKI